CSSLSAGTWCDSLIRKFSYSTFELCFRTNKLRLYAVQKLGQWGTALVLDHPRWDLALIEPSYRINRKAPLMEITINVTIPDDVAAAIQSVLAAMRRRRESHMCHAALPQRLDFFTGVFETGTCPFNPSFPASVSTAWLRNPFETSGSRKLVWVARLLSTEFQALSDYHQSRQQAAGTQSI